MAKKVAYVTGGMGGIGTAICQRLVKEGFAVIAGCGPSRDWQKWLDEQKALGYEFHASVGNVADWQSTVDAFTKASAECGTIEVLVNNAGITRDRMFLKMTPEDWKAVIDTNLNSMFNVTKQVVPGMVEKGWGRIIQISSVNGEKGQSGQTNYSAAKAGMHGFTMALAQEMAAKGVTVLDDGTIADRRGSLNVDDEGCASQKNVLIEDGILRGYIQDSLNARLMGVAPTGNGRRESYAHLPMPRMTNTYMLGGDKDPAEIIASIKKGLYASNFGGGQVDITSGKFVFSASQAWWVENGKLLYPVKGATIVGSGPESLKKITLIGNDLALDSGVGTCGKEGQSVPVGVGQPTLRIEGLTVGGTA